MLDLGTFYAGPFGSAMLADQGARVVKVEPLPGDPIRFQMPIPESAGVRVTQGKESIAVDVFTEEGLAIVIELARRADMVLHCYRGGVAERMGLDAATLQRDQSRPRLPPRRRLRHRRPERPPLGLRADHRRGLGVRAAIPVGGGIEGRAP